MPRLYDSNCIAQRLVAPAILARVHERRHIDERQRREDKAEAYHIAALDIVKQRGRITTSEPVADAVSAAL